MRKSKQVFVPDVMKGVSEIWHWWKWDIHEVNVTFNFLNLISLSLTPSYNLCQIWINLFQRHHIQNKNWINMRWPWSLAIKTLSPTQQLWQMWRKFLNTYQFLRMGDGEVATALTTELWTPTSNQFPWSDPLRAFLRHRVQTNWVAVSN